VDRECLTKTFNVTVKEDQLTQKGANVEKVRAQHLTWARSDPQYAAGLIEDGGKDKFWTQYDFCVHVDTEAL
jgi:hypothetical protein